jgi:hypothetical protein
MEKIVIRAIIALYVFGISTYLFTTVVPVGKFHTYDTSAYGPTENVRYLRTIYDVQENIQMLFPEVVGWEKGNCTVDFQRTLEGTGALDLDCKEYTKDENTIWFFIIYGNETETAQIDIRSNGNRRIALYWMLFNSPYKDASRGAYLYRLSSPVTESVGETKEMLTAMAAASMVATFQEALEDTVIEYYGKNFGLLFYIPIGFVYFVAGLFFIKPELLPFY